MARRAEGRLAIDAGIGGRYRAGADVPVRVTISADRLIHDTLRVRTDPLDGLGPEIRVAVDVAGGSTKVVRLVVPTFGGNGPLDVSATLASDQAAKNTPVVTRIGPFGADEEVVGMTNAATPAEGLPRQMKLAQDLGTAIFTPLSLGQVSSPGALDSYDTIGATVADLDGLRGGDRRRLLDWVAAGGRLLVDGASGHAKLMGSGVKFGRDGVPAGVGRGTVTVTGIRLRTGRLDGLIIPAARVSSFFPGISMNFGSGNLGDELARDSGLRIATVKGLGLLLLGYVVLIGPLTMTILRRRGRAHQAWTVVPALALISTGVVYGVGRAQRQGLQPSHASIVEFTPVGPRVTTYTAMVVNDPSTARVLLPSSWKARGGEIGAIAGPDAFNQSFGGGGGAVGAGTAINLTQDGPEVALRLAAGQVGTVAASGPVDGAGAPRGALEVIATSARSGEASGFVRNTLPFALDSVVVFVNGGLTRLGRIGAGQKVAFTVHSGQSFGLAFGLPLGFAAWPEASGNRNQMIPARLNGDPPQVTKSTGSSVNLAAFTAWAGSVLPLGVEPGKVTAIGWTRDWVPPVSVRQGGRTRRPTKGRTAFVATVAVAPIDHLTDMVSSQQVLRGAANTFGTSSQGAAVIEFVVPSGWRPTRLMVRASTFLGIEVRLGGEWKTVAEPPDPTELGRGPSEMRDTEVPTGAISAEGRVFLRTTAPSTFGAAASLFAPTVTIREPRADDLTPEESARVGAQMLGGVPTKVPPFPPVAVPVPILTLPAVPGPVRGTGVATTAARSDATPGPTLIEIHVRRPATTVPVPGFGGSVAPVPVSTAPSALTPPTIIASVAAPTTAPAVPAPGPSTTAPAAAPRGN